MGETEIPVELEPVLQVYVLAPDAAKLILWPEHNALVPEILTVGKGFTVTANDAAAALTQPAVLVPLNV